MAPPGNASNFHRFLIASGIEFGALWGSILKAFLDPKFH